MSDALCLPADLKTTWMIEFVSDRGWITKHTDGWYWSVMSQGGGIGPFDSPGDAALYAEDPMEYHRQRKKTG